MFPTIKEDDYVFIQPIKEENILLGDLLKERNGRKRRLKSKRYQIMNLFLSWISPFSYWIYPIGSRVKQSGRMILGGFLEKLQSPKFFRR